MVEILPSILSADFMRLGEQVTALDIAGCKMLHVDVMDGHFVPNLTVGPPLVESLRRGTSMILDVHLMIADADRYAPIFIDAGADQVSVHQESTPHLDRVLRLIQSKGAKAGVVINPSTPVGVLADVLDVADYVLVMSVNPGFGGQRFIANALDKVRKLVARKKERGLQFTIQIDGGITKENVAEVVNAGVEWVVAGSAVFHGVTPQAAYCELRDLARAAESVSV